MRLPPLPSPWTVLDSASNAWDLVLGGGVADLAPQPSTVVDAGPQRTVRRYAAGLDGRRGRRARRSPVLLVPPLGAPAACFDLRRGCSLVEHLVDLGHPTYVVDYGPIGFGDRALGLEHWVEDVIPGAIRAVSEDAGGAPVQTVGWSLGGIMLLLAEADAPGLPVASVSLVASPFDLERVPLLSPIRTLDQVTGGTVGTALYRVLGGAPAPLVSLAFRATAADRYVARPLFLAANLHDREAIAHMEAVDAYMASMMAYPGRSIGQLYHAFFRVNDLADGRVELADRRIDLRSMRLPVLAVAGEDDVLAPREAVHHVADLLEGAPEIRLETAPGGHLGALTGMRARETTWRHLDEWLAGHEPAGGAATSSSRP